MLIQQRYNMAARTIRKRKLTFPWKKKNHDDHKELRQTPEWAAMRAKVYERDNFTCVSCKRKEGTPTPKGKVVLNPHHHKICVKTCLAEGKLDEIFNIDNVITLCQGCHCKVHGGRR